MRTLNFAVLALSAAVWHCWRIMTLRPAFDHLKPSKFSIAVFAGLYFAAGAARYGASGIPALIITFAFLILIMPMEKPEVFKDLSPTWTLVLSILALSASVDTVAVAVSLASGAPPKDWFLIEIAYVLATLVLYSRYRKETKNNEQNPGSR